MPAPVNEKLTLIFGSAARDARQRLGLTQADVAERVGIAMEVYSRMERGKMLPRAQTLRRLCDVLRVSADVLLGVGTGSVPVPLAPRREGRPAREDPAELRRLSRTLRALEPAQLKAVSRVVNAVVSVMPKAAAATPAARPARRRKTG